MIYITLFPIILAMAGIISRNHIEKRRARRWYKHA